MNLMTPKKRKSSKVALEEEEQPEMTLDFSEELEAQVKEAEEIAKAKKSKKKEQQKDKPIREDKIKQNINKVKAKEGIIGYILRNAKSASIDLKDPTKVIDYAVLSSSALEASDELSNTFDLGDVKSVVVEGNTVKLLSFNAEENKVSVFMDKSVNHKRIHKDLLD
jgi:predicted regulator of Ras-like GTPase activity (Roadblock/LC7/MglB family)